MMPFIRIRCFKSSWYCCQGLKHVLVRLFSCSPDPVRPRLRFAPSPTGFLHLGGLRTALYNHLMCRNKGGTFVLRIEDTDKTRTVPGALDNILESLDWFGISPDEGPGQGGPYAPYVQSERLELYQKHAEKLIEKGAAYRCFCSALRLELMRKDAVKTGEISRYDNRCRDLSPAESSLRQKNGEPSVVRLKLRKGTNSFYDVVCGPISFSTDHEGDPVLMKSDGFPTYHLANVIDDHLMKITHVLRGIEWQVSTPKHLQLYEAFGWTPPLFAHLPLLINADGSKLSKRKGALDILDYRKQGILPEALMNLLTQAGGGYRDSLAQTSALHDLKHLVEHFELERVNQNSCQLNFTKLVDYNRQALSRRLKDSVQRMELLKEARTLIKEKFSVDPDDAMLSRIIGTAEDRLTGIADLVTGDMEFVWTQREAKQLVSEKCLQDLARVSNFLISLSQLSVDVANQTEVTRLLRTFAEENSLKFNEIMQTMRLALCGLPKGPSVGEMISVLGIVQTLKRIELFLKQQITARKLKSSM